MILPCIICGKEMRESFAGTPDQPLDGTNFTSYGHYGSSAFDELDGSFLTVNFCDPCLTKAGDEGKVLQVFPAPPIKRNHVYQTWDSKE